MKISVIRKSHWPNNFNGADLLGGNPEKPTIDTAEESIISVITVCHIQMQWQNIEAAEWSYTSINMHPTFHN